METALPFYKTSGAGNDFIALVEPLPAAAFPGARLGPEQVRAWCARGLSVGADGLFLLAQEGPGAVRMTHYNADGSEAALCVNGTRCAARLAFELGWGSAGAVESAGESEGDRVAVSTGAGRLEARRLAPDEISLELPDPIPTGAGAPAAVAPVVDDRPWSGFLVTVGVPHLVLPWNEGLETAPVTTLGPRLRAHPDVGPAGANVDFVRFVDAHRIEVRSFERGVEGETLACGSGVLSAVAVGLATGRSALPVAALTRGGFELRVEPAEGRSDGWALAGDARLVARGELLPSAAILPTPPGW